MTPSALTDDTPGDRLKAARIKAGYKSSRQAAMALDINYSTYNGHENGQNLFGVDDALRYARFFGSNAEWLLLGEQRPVFTPANLEDALRDIRWTPDILARCFGCDVSLVHAWLDGNAEIPMKAAVWLKVLAVAHRGMEDEKPKSLQGKRYRE